MTKLEFMKELESLLLDVPLEEREEALQYYRDYFEDAGEDREEDIIKELGDPAKIAAIIKAELNSDGADREKRGYFTEKGYQDSLYNEAKCEIVGAGAKAQEDTAGAGQRSRDGSGAKTGWQTQNQYRGQTNTNNTALVVLIAVLSFPIWFPLLGGIFGVLLGIAGALFGLIVGLGAAGIAMIATGVALFIGGLIELTVPFIGLLCCGGGLIIFGLGMLLTVACGALCRGVVPAFIKGIVSLCRLPFKNRRVMA